MPGVVVLFGVLGDLLVSLLNNNGGAYHQSPRGEMFFGGIGGLNAFYPERIVDNPYVPPVVLTSFEIFNRESTKELCLGEETFP